MKEALYKIFNIGYDGIIITACCGFVTSFFIPIKGFLLFTIFAVFADTITGIKAAKARKEKISSRGLYRTSEKVVVYFVAIMIFEGAKNTFSIPVPITYMVAFTIATTELFSIAENIRSITGVNIGTFVVKFFKNQK